VNIFKYWILKKTILIFQAAYTESE